MGRVNLKELKQALNELPEENLDVFFITHKMAMDEPEAGLGLVFYADEEEHATHKALYDSPAYEVVKEFIEAVERDCKKSIVCDLDADLEDHYCDDSE